MRGASKSFLRALEKARENDREHARDPRRWRVAQALNVHLSRRDTNNGRTYCIDCDANERGGKIAHNNDCIARAVMLAYDSEIA